MENEEIIKLRGKALDEAFREYRERKIAWREWKAFVEESGYDPKQGEAPTFVRAGNAPMPEIERKEK